MYYPCFRRFHGRRMDCRAEASLKPKRGSPQCHAAGCDEPRSYMELQETSPKAFVVEEPYNNVLTKRRWRRSHADGGWAGGGVGVGAGICCLVSLLVVRVVRSCTLTAL